jgi:hypothetical protein
MHGPQSLALCLPILLALVSASASGASDSIAESSVEVTLLNTKAHRAATALRTIADTRQFEIVADQVIRIHGTPENLKVAEHVLALADSGTDAALTAFTVPSDQSRICAFRPERISPEAAMKALRQVLRISRVASQQEPALVIIRDTPEQADAAQALIEILDQACP